MARGEEESLAGGAGSVAASAIRSVVFDAGLQEQQGAQLLHLVSDPEDGVNDRIGIAHRVNRDLALAGAHAYGVDFVIND